MTDEQINASFKTLTYRVSGQVAAIKHMVNAIRAQPHFDQQAFDTFLAAFQVVAEESDSWDLEFRKGYEETLSSFATPLPSLPPNRYTRDRAPKGPDHP